MLQSATSLTRAPYCLNQRSSTTAHLIKCWRSFSWLMTIRSWSMSRSSSSRCARTTMGRFCSCIAIQPSTVNRHMSRFLGVWLKSEGADLTILQRRTNSKSNLSCQRRTDWKANLEYQWHSLVQFTRMISSLSTVFKLIYPSSKKLREPLLSSSRRRVRLQSKTSLKSQMIMISRKITRTLWSGCFRLTGFRWRLITSRKISIN